MKKLIYRLLAITLLAFHPVVFADNASQAVKISLTDASGNQLNPDDVQAIRQLVGKAISHGLISDFVIYNQSLKQQDQFFACAQASASSTANSFNHFVNQLHAISPQTAVNYTLTYTKKCNKNNELVCSVDSVSCLNSAIVSSPAYQEELTRGVFAAGWADINAGKASMLERLNKGYGYDVTDPFQIGLPAITKNCSAITATGTAADGNATIVCTLSGNATIVGATITLTLTGATQTWACAATGNGTGDITRYQGKCS